jgi:hypothetical protein
MSHIARRRALIRLRDALAVSDLPNMAFFADWASAMLGKTHTFYSLGDGSRECRLCGRDLLNDFHRRAPRD